MQCGINKSSNQNRSNNEEFINKANKIHNNKYDYSKINYFNVSTKIEIICKFHGSFFQIPNSHLNGSGCPVCIHTISKCEVLWLDFLNITERNFTIKINNKRFKVDGYDPKTNTCYEFNGDYFHGNPKIFNPDTINPTVKKSFGELFQNTIRKEQILKEAGYNVISIWESDFKELDNGSFIQDQHKTY